MSNPIFKKIFIVFLFITFFTLGVIYQWSKVVFIKEIESEEQIQPKESEEYIDFTEVMLDKRTFMCRGDVDLIVNEIGVVTFTCDTEDEKLTFTLNPVEMFVTRHWAKRGVNDMGTAEEESE